MYDMPHVGAWGYFDKGTADERYQNKKQIAEQRTKEYGAGKLLKLAAVLNIQLDDQPDYVKQYSAYYKTKRGYHKRSVNSNEGWVLQKYAWLDEY